jgi:hypothetical protein
MNPLLKRRKMKWLIKIIKMIETPKMTGLRMKAGLNNIPPATKDLHVAAPALAAKMRESIKAMLKWAVKAAKLVKKNLAMKDMWSLAVKAEKLVKSKWLKKSTMSVVRVVIKVVIITTALALGNRKSRSKDLLGNSLEGAIKQVFASLHIKL